MNIFENIILCPSCNRSLLIKEKKIICESCVEIYPIVYGIPVLITKKECDRLKLDYYTENFEQKILDSDIFKKNKHGIMNYLKEILIYTNGIPYQKIFEPKKYPIANIPFKENKNNLFLIDIGCGWGRWTISAAQKGYISFGIDKNLTFLIFAKKISESLNLNNCNFICSDVLNLPIKSNTFDRAFSYSFLQHFSENNLLTILKQTYEIMKSKSIFKTQMVNKYSLRGYYNNYKIKYSRPELLKKGWVDDIEGENSFEVRYFSYKKINKIFKDIFIIDKIKNYSFFTQAQFSDLEILPFKYKVLLIITKLTNFFLNLIPYSKIFSDNLIFTLKKK